MMLAKVACGGKMSGAQALLGERHAQQMHQRRRDGVTVTVRLEGVGATT